MRVLTRIKTIKEGDYTYNLMCNGMVHINNHKTNNKSIIVPISNIFKIKE